MSKNLERKLAKYAAFVVVVFVIYYEITIWVFGEIIDE